MNRRIEVPNLEELAERHLAGESMQELARELGIGNTTLHRKLRPFTDQRRPYGATYVPDLQVLITAYQAGESLKSISDRTGIGRRCLKNQMEKQGINMRGRSGAETIKWKHREDRHQWMKPAWMVNTGSESIHEAPFVRALRKRGLTVATQYRFARYRVDVALCESRVAVELSRGGTLAHNTEFKRLEKIFDEGWSILFVRVPHRKTIDPQAAADDVIAYVEVLCPPEPIRGQYGMIGGHPGAASRAGRNLAAWTFVPGPG